MDWCGVYVLHSGTYWSLGRLDICDSVCLDIKILRLKTPLTKRFYRLTYVLYLIGHVVYPEVVTVHSLTSYPGDRESKILKILSVKSLRGRGEDNPTP